MPSEETEDSHAHEKQGGEKNAYQKLFYFFRFRKKGKNTPEERRDQLEKDMRSNWDELPTTLKRRKERLSQSVLDEFHNEHSLESTDGETSKTQQSKPTNGELLLLREQINLRELEKLKENLHRALSSATDLDSEQRHVVDLLRRAVSSEDSLLQETSSSSTSSSSEDHGQQDSGTDVSEVPGNYEELSAPRKGRGTSKSAEDESTVSYYDAVVRDNDDDEIILPPPITIPKINKDYVSMDRLRAIAEETYDKPRPSRWKRQLTEPPRTMDTIVEEEEKLSVREILRRFEMLGNQVSPQGENSEEKSATLKQIQETLRCLEEKVRIHEGGETSPPGTGGDTTPEEQIHQKQQHILPITDNYQQQQHHHQQQQQHQHITTNNHHSPSRAIQQSTTNSSATTNLDGWTGRIPQTPHQPSVLSAAHESTGLQGQHDGKHSLLQFAMLHFRQSPEKFEMLKTADGSISGSLKVIESLKSKKNKAKKGNKENDWTWKEQVDLVKFSPSPIEQSLLRLESTELNDLAIECFVSVMRYMGDLPMTPDVTEVKCVYTILMHCHKHEALRDEVYCQLMKQTTNNKSLRPDSCQRGWRLFSIVAAYFVCSDTLRPYLFKYLETAAYDKRRAYHGTATVCLHNLRKTFKYGGRKNVPSVEEITAISAGRNSKRQIYRLPGGTERVVNTKCTTVVQDVIEEICAVINVQAPAEMEEFSLYCIVEGDTFTMPLAREEYILDVTTELHKNQQIFYLIFCRSVWHFPLRLDSQLYIEVVFNQIAPDYLEGLLLVMPGEQLEQDIIYDIAKMAALLHRAADMTHLPSMKETKFLLPKPALTVRDVKPAQWVNMVQGNWREVEGLSTVQAKAQVLDILSKWPLFGSSFFAVKRVSDPKERSEHILALNRHGVHFIDLVTHETLIHYPFSEVISTRKVKSEDGILFLDMKCGNLMQQRITRLQTDQAHEISRLIRQYITMEQRLRMS